ncbi:serum paraoxonase/arylesterase 2-like isoform X1 [Sebastes umbrosus]|uniref:serum paraoxonase/arylesterase 2-like isoform X1 n=1 Tax=Sebastes umbrosus TaxID=72105 RepID=UPI0018A053C4|nr:serum paraoxonase/arylesterase 2-like isoform X1 [Sebastes umbrosus]
MTFLNMVAMKKLLVAAVVAAFAAFIGHRFLKLKEMALASRDMPMKHLNCRYLMNIEYGAEDITILRDGLALISTGLKYPGMPSFSDDPGKMYVLDLLHPKPTPVELQIKGGLDLSSFNPHGISVYIDEADDAVYLFVVNHPQHKSQVEIFHFVQDDTLVHLKTITHPLLHRYVLCNKPFTVPHILHLTISIESFISFIISFSVNDIVAVGVESFYATNDHSFTNEALHFLTIILDLPSCDVVYYSPQEVRVAASGFMSANGINISPDKRYIYVSDILGHEIDVYERQEGEQLVHVKSVAVGSLCDNIEVDHRTGDLWLGCHPNGMKFSTYDPEDPPGSEVIRIKNIHSEQPVVSLEYGDNGRVLMASSVAAPYEGKLLIGSVFHKALCCNLK